MFIFNRRFILLFFLISCQFILFSGCVAPFSELQSAKLVGPGRVETTAHFSTVSFSDEDEISHIQSSYGVQSAIGVHRLMDFRIRYERIGLDPEVSELAGVGVLGIGPKFSIIKDWAAFYLPIGFAYGSDIKVSDTWQIHPTLLFTIPLGRYIEFNPSTKVLIPFKRGQETTIAVNLGAGFSTNLNRWAIRPEIGFLYNPGDSGYFTQLSIGFSYYLGFSIYPR